jgi:hypothetical protein
MSTLGNIGKWAVRIVVVLAIPLCISIFVDLRMKTIRSMRDTAVFLTERHNESELQAKYRLPHVVYSNYADVPLKFQRGLHAGTNCAFHLYTKEGVPYWYFVAAVNRQSGVVDYGVATNY